MSIVLTASQVSYYSNQLISHEFLVLSMIIRPQHDFRRERDLPIQFSHSFLDLIIFESPEMYGQKIRQSLDQGTLIRIDQIITFIAFELIPSCQFLFLAIVTNAIVQRDVGLRYNKTEIYLFFLSLRDYIILQITCVANLAFGSCDTFGEEFLLKGGYFVFIFTFYLIVYFVHQPDIELVAILVSISFENGRGSFDIFHEFGC